MRMFLLVVAAIIGGIVYLAYKDHVWWQEYSVANHCALTGEEDVYVTFAYIYGSNGNITGAIPQVNTRRQYKCNGEEYIWRG